MELDLFSDSKRPKWRKSGAIFGVPGPTLVESGTDKQASQTKYFLTLRPMTPYVALGLVVRGWESQPLGKAPQETKLKSTGWPGWASEPVRELR